LLLWLIYDISDNCIRTRTSEKCKDYGLFRVQKSAFFGDIKPEAVKHLSQDIEEILERDAGSEEDSVLIIPSCRACMQKKIVIGKGFDMEQYMEREYVILD
jgi:CRISPR-associated protein Cas2